jgi:hypothetical protein
MGTVLHNVLDGISSSWAESEQMGVLMVDFIKAFDSVEHEFIKKSLEYFNIGPVMVGMVMTLLTERKACINLSDRYTGNFNIERGTPQGDRSSPYIFVICVEILLIKLEMGGGGTIVGREAVNSEGQEINSVGEAFADDVTVVYKLKEGATKKILEILDGFGSVSGLQVNREKTHIMVTGTEWGGASDIEGIKIKSECKLLGIMIDNKNARLQQNWDSSIIKIRGLINYWNQYNLSLTGRVMVAKTFLLSQITFLMGIIPMEKKTADQIEIMIEKYTLGKLQVARDRIYNKIEQGGLGLLKIWELNIAMKSSWVNRWKREGRGVDITGGRVLNSGSGREMELVDHKKIDKNKFPAAYSIACAWNDFRTKVYENDGNLYGAKLFGNPGIKNRVGKQLGEGNIFSRIRYRTVHEQVKNAKIGDIVEEAGIKERAEISAMWGIEITEVEYGKLREAVQYVRGKFKPVWEMREKCKTIKEWLAPVKKGSKQLRKLMSGRGSRQYRNFTFRDIRPISTLWEQMGIELDDTLIGCAMTLWGIRELDPDFRQFIFRWNQGMVHGNTVISHFGENVDRRCTFCKNICVKQMQEELGRELTEQEVSALQIPDENRPHIMWHCPVIQECTREIYNKVWEKNGPVDKKSFLMGKIVGFLETSQLYMVINMFIKYRIWKYKLAGVLPMINSICNDTKNFLDNLKWYHKWRILLPLVRQLV